NENTRSVMVAHVATPGKRIPTNGSETIPGSSMPGIPVNVFFENVDGASTGELLPTGEPLTEVNLGGSSIAVSCIDAGAPSCFVNAAELGMSGRSEEHTSELQSRFDLVCRLLLEKKNN